jgi:hypothetical protein
MQQFLERYKGSHLRSQNCKTVSGVLKGLHAEERDKKPQSQQVNKIELLRH